MTPMIMCNHAIPVRLNNINGMFIPAMVMLSHLLKLARRVTDKTIISAGVIIVHKAANKNPSVISKTNTLPAIISLIEFGMYR